MAIEQVASRRWRLRDLGVFRPDAAVRADGLVSMIAVAAGAILLLAGVAKFAWHGSELDAFRRFGLPVPQVTVLLVGVLETVGGVLLILRRLVAPTAVVEASIMAVAVAVSGIAHGDVIPSLTLAPLLLGALAFILARTLRPARPAPRHARSP